MKRGRLLAGGMAWVAGAAVVMGLCGGCRSARVAAPTGLTASVEGSGAGEAARVYIPGGEERRYRVEGTGDIEYRRSEEADASGEWSVVIREGDNGGGDGAMRIVTLQRRADGGMALASIEQTPGGLTAFDPPIAVMPAGGVAALRAGEAFVGKAGVESAGERGDRSGSAMHETELLGYDDAGRAIVRQRLFMDLGVVTVERALMITADAEGIVREEQARTVKFGLLVVDREKRAVVRISE